jgi:hypothetical protein
MPGTKVRVDVVGEEAFSTKVQSEAIDYRFSRGEGLDLELVSNRIASQILKRP